MRSTNPQILKNQILRCVTQSESTRVDRDRNPGSSPRARELDQSGYHLRHPWPSGLRRCVQVAVSSEAWVRILPDADQEKLSKIDFTIFARARELAHGFRSLILDLVNSRALMAQIHLKSDRKSD